MEVEGGVVQVERGLFKVEAGRGLAEGEDEGGAEPKCILERECTQVDSDMSLAELRRARVRARAIGQFGVYAGSLL